VSRPALASLLLLLCPALAGAQALSVRERRPLTTALVVGAPGGAGLEVSFNTSDRTAFGGHATTWIAVTEAALFGRYFLLAGERAGLYAEGAVRAYYAPLLFGERKLAPGLGGLVGAEWRAEGGFTAGLAAGATLTWVPLGAESEQGQVIPVPSVALRLGYSW
jgi:hypothetical protein